MNEDSSDSDGILSLEIIDGPVFGPEAPSKCISERDIIRFNDSLKQKAVVQEQEYVDWTEHIDRCRSCKIKFIQILDDPTPAPDPTLKNLLVLKRAIAETITPAFQSEMKAMGYDLISSKHQELPRFSRIVDYSEVGFG